nr:MAG TPA: shock protein B [Caudoviricetes sp.]
MNLLTKIKNWLEKEINTDWRIVALDTNRALIDLQEKYQQANQRIADLEKIVAIYKEKENSK